MTHLSASRSAPQRPVEDPLTLPAPVSGYTAMVLLGPDNGASLLEQAAELKDSPYALHRSRGVQMERELRLLQMAAQQHLSAQFRAQGYDETSAYRSARALVGDSAAGSASSLDGCDGPVLTAREAAERLRLTPRQVINLLDQGEGGVLLGAKRGGAWLIDEASVDREALRRSERERSE